MSTLGKIARSMWLGAFALDELVLNVADHTNWHWVRIVLLPIGIFSLAQAVWRRP